MSKTKKLTAGVPVVDSSGTVTPVSIAQLAKQVGTELGVQSASYQPLLDQWLRIAEINAHCGLIMITNTYYNTAPVGCLIAFSGANQASKLEAKIITGQPQVFDKVRFVHKSNSCFFEIHCTARNIQDRLSIRSFATQANYTSSAMTLMTVTTEGSIPEGYSTKELTLSDLKLGG